MRLRCQSRDGRGQSEILGTVLVFSLVILLGTTLVGIGVLLFDDAGREFDNRQGQDAVREIGDRLIGAETGALLEVPDAAREDIEITPDEGTVTVNVTTLPRGVNVTTGGGGWRNITAADILAENMTNETTLQLGTLTHRADGGATTVYQGGLLLEQQGNYTEIISEPQFDYQTLNEVALANIDLSFTSLSGLGQTLDSETLVQRDRAGSRQLSERIEEMVARQRTLTGVRDFVPTTSVEITVTIETAYPEAWATYATERMTEPLPEDQVVVGDDRVELQFPTFGGEALSVPDFQTDVLYSGVAGVAPLFYNTDAEGNISAVDPGFTLRNNGSPMRLRPGGDGSDYGIAVVQNERWLILNESVEWGNAIDANETVWTDITGTETRRFDTPALDTGESDVGGNGTDTWEFTDDVSVCVVTDGGSVTTNDVRELVAEGACSQTVVGDPEPPRQQPRLVIDSLRGPTSPVQFGDEVELNASINNTGTGYADGSFVGAAADLGGDTLDLVAVDEVSRYPFEEPVNVTLRFNPRKNFNDTAPVELFTLDDSATANVTVVDPPSFDIDSSQTLDAGALPGKPFNVSATITNTGANATQTVALFESGDVVDTEQLQLGTNETDTTSLTWNVPLDASIDAATELTIDTGDDTTTLDVDRLPEALITNVSVDNTLPSNSTVPVTVSLENPSGTEEVSDTPVRIDPSVSDLLADGPVVNKTVDIPSGGTETVSFDLTQSSDPITDWVPVETNDDSAEGVGVVERSGPVCSDVTYDGGTGTETDPYQISNVDQLQCIDDEEPVHSSWEDSLGDNYRLVDDIAAHGTEYWNSGDGFVPIGEVDASSDAGTAFTGDLNGTGHTIQGLTIDRYDDAFVGLFAITAKFDGGSAVGEGVTIENLVLDDVDVRGMTVVGGLVGGAGGEFKQISVDGDVESQYQQVGGLIGHGHDADLTNKLVSTANVSGNEPVVLDDDDEHPWQETTKSPNLGIGGLLGGMGFDTKFSVGYSRADVSGPSSVGGITGWTSNNPSDLSQMYWADGTLSLVDSPEVFDGTEREQFTDPLQTGGIAGRIGEPSGGEDTIFNSVYSDGPTVGDGGNNVNDNSVTLDGDRMTGPQVLPDPDSGHDFSQYDGVANAEEFFEQYPGVEPEDANGSMAELDWDIWEPVYETEVDPTDGTVRTVNESYPIFEWESDGFVTVEITDVSTDTLEPGTLSGDRDLTVKATVENTGDTTQTQTITMQNPRTDVASVVDSETVELDAGGSESLEFTWQTGFADRLNETQNGTIIVSGDDDADTRAIDLLSFVPTKLNVTALQVPDSVEALNGSLTLSGGPDGGNFTLQYDGSPLTSVSARAIRGERIGLVAGNNIVDAVILNESRANTLTNDTAATVDLSWTPTLADIGTTDIEVQVLGSQQRAVNETKVVSPADPFVTGDTLPVDADLDLITGG